MSRHWNSRDFYGGGWRPSGGEIRLTLIGGVMLGLVFAAGSYATWPGWGGGRETEPEANIPVTPDYYAESRRSRDILRAQERGPIPRTEAAKPNDWAETVGASGRVDVIDGDTFDYRGSRIRIADIDTPETHPARCAYEAELGERATRRLAQLLAAGPFKLQPIDRDTDQYGRKLRVVTRGGRSLGDQLVSEGLARTWTGHREPWC